MNLREDQKKVLDEILSAIRKGETKIALQAPMGWGKSVVALRIALELDVPTAILTSRLAIVEKFIEEAKKFSIRRNIIATAGARELCTRGYKVPYKKCNKCALKRDFIPNQFYSHLTWKELKTLVPEDVCPYWTQRFIERSYDIIVAHYGRWRSLRRYVAFVIVDEAHNLFVPRISSIPLSQLQELLQKFGVERIEDLKEVEIGEENEDVEEILEKIKESEIIIEDGDEILVVSKYDHEIDRHALFMSATLPSQLKSQSYIEIRPQVKAKAYIVEDIDTSYYNIRDSLPQIRDTVLAVYLTKKPFVVFGTRRVLNFVQIGDRFEAWGKYNEGVDLPQYDIAVVFWPSLHIEVRRYLRSYSIDPNEVELIRAIQLSGRILRPTERIKEKIIIFADKRFTQYVDVLNYHFDVEVVSSEQLVDKI